MAERVWHMLEVSEVSEYLKVVPQTGLSRREAVRRLRRYGPNAISHKRRISPWPILLGQFQDFMILTLLAATVISAALGEVADALTIAAIVLLNATLGFFQEYRAEKSLEALKELSAPTARVTRDGRQEMIAAAELVPGDIITLEAGDRVPADARLGEAAQFRVDESVLTGESVPAGKNTAASEVRRQNPGDQKNMVFMGTTVTSGRAMGIVAATGMQTEIGQIARMIDTIGTESTPLQKRLEQLGKWLVLACLLICAVVSLAGVWRGEPFYSMFMSGVSLAVAAIPEGLPAIVTVALAIGVQRMVRRQALIRKLPAVETLGCATVICSDKTGTLTENRMTVRELYCGGRSVTVTGTGYTPEGMLSDSGREVSAYSSPGLAALLSACVWCNNAQLQAAERPAGVIGRVKSLRQPGERWTVQGDPTEGALLVAAVKAGLSLEDLRREQPRVAELPFDSDRKRMSVLCRLRTGEQYLYLKGAVEAVLPRCTAYQQDQRTLPLDQKAVSAIMAANVALARSGQRVLAVACRRLSGKVDPGDEAGLEQNLTFLGLVGMVDPPRVEVKASIALCHAAGIRTVMVTGDHRATAEAIACELALLGPDEIVLTGEELDAMGEAELGKVVGRVGVFARVSPRHKLRIVRALKASGQVVAMTGDGVNDAPAIKEADIGVAMGQAGTDVTKEAAAMVLLDDNFATLVAAVEEGRGIYANIRKFIRYLLACNVGEVLTMFLATIVGLPLPLQPIQILWVNLVTDGLPALALGVDPADWDTMQRPPRRVEENIFAGGLSRKIATRGVLIGLSTVAVFALSLLGGSGDLARARTLALATLVMCQLIHVFDCRSERLSLFEIDWWTNVSLLLAVLLSVGLLLVVIYVPPLQGIFETVPLGVEEWALVLAVSSVGSIVIGLRRLQRYRRRKR